jgi:serine/threonine protein phosphatase PrpC
VSRALGDAAFKLGPRGPLVSACPEVTSAQLDVSRDEFVVLACDGLWDVMSSEETVAFVRERLKR